MATRDESAFTEAREHLSDFTDVERLDFEYTRIQSDDLEEIAGVGGADAYDNAPRLASDEAEDDERPPVVVEETGLFVDELDGFPGPYTDYVEDTLGVEKFWNLIEGIDDRRAVYQTGLAFVNSEQVVTFAGAREGELVEPRGPEDAGFDRLFQIQQNTLAEMSVEQRNSVSSRGRAMTRLADWLVS